MIETKTQNSKIKELRQNLEGRERACEESRSKYEGLGARLAELKANLPSLKQAVQDAETRKQKALDAYAMDESQTQQLEKAREVFELAEKTEIESLELLAALERAMPQMQQEVVEADSRRTLFHLTQL